MRQHLSTQSHFSSSSFLAWNTGEWKITSVKFGQDKCLQQIEIRETRNQQSPNQNPESAEWECRKSRAFNLYRSQSIFVFRESRISVLNKKKKVYYRLPLTHICNKYINRVLRTPNTQSRLNLKDPRDQFCQKSRWLLTWLSLITKDLMPFSVCSMPQFWVRLKTLDPSIGKYGCEDAFCMHLHALLESWIVANFSLLCENLWFEKLAEIWHVTRFRAEQLFLITTELLKKSDVGLDHWPGQANGVNRISEGHATALHDVRNNKSGRAGTARGTMHIYYLQFTFKKGQNQKQQSLTWPSAWAFWRNVRAGSKALLILSSGLSSKRRCR